MVIKGSKDDSKSIEMRQYKYQINGKKYEVSVETPAADGTIAVTVNGETYSVVREPEPVVEKKKVVVKPVAAKPSAGGDEMQDALRSPLPGTVIEILAKGEPLPEKHKDHPLVSNWNGYRECHIQSDWLLIYKYKDNELILSLTATGSHSDLF